MLFSYNTLLTFFPLPSQQQYWKHVHLMPETSSLVTLTLRGTQLPLQRWMTGFRPKAGTTGSSTAQTADETHTSRIAPPPSNNIYSSVLLHGTGAATMVEASKLALRPQKRRSVTWPKPLYWPDIPTHADPTDPRISTYPPFVKILQSSRSSHSWHSRFRQLPVPLTSTGPSTPRWPRPLPTYSPLLSFLYFDRENTP
jgi:anaerobic selenocysteine-containing dehydrogenase